LVYTPAVEPFGRPYKICCFPADGGGGGGGRGGRNTHPSKNVLIGV